MCIDFETINLFIMTPSKIKETLLIKATDDHNNQLDKHNYVIARDFINPETLEMLSQYCTIQLNKKYFDSDGFVKNAKYGDPVMESFLVTIKPSIEKLLNKQLLPTYSYMRIYRKGDKLTPHVDRDACEFTATIPINYQSSYLWPLWLYDKSKKKTYVELERHDCLVYKGCDVVHGRDSFEGDFWIQVFLHFVDKEGKNARHVYDGRPGIGAEPPKFSLPRQIKAMIFKKFIYPKQTEEMMLERLDAKRKSGHMETR
jgi:hypothetical protein